jgi:hypothetical protein
MILRKWVISLRGVRFCRSIDWWIAVAFWLLPAPCADAFGAEIYNILAFHLTHSSGSGRICALDTGFPSISRKLPKMFYPRSPRTRISRWALEGSAVRHVA